MKRRELNIEWDLRAAECSIRNVVKAIQTTEMRYEMKEKNNENKRNIKGKPTAVILVTGIATVRHGVTSKLFNNTGAVLALEFIRTTPLRRTGRATLSRRSNV